MPRLVVRRPASRAADLFGPALVALGLGALAGFVLGELYGPATARRLTSPARRPTTTSLAELVHDAQAALLADPFLAEHELEVRPVSRQTVGLHGWVPSRSLRSRAQRIVREALTSGEVINRVLVRGEDDAGSPTIDILSA
jgi:hypothetical protein